ncbi:MAG: hypothetical protein ACREC6_06560 [Hyphomicrobiaceae bacterium]
MAASEEHADIVLLGTTASGKSFLIASLRSCARWTHGLAADVTVQLRDEAGSLGADPVPDADGNFTLSLHHAEERAWSGRKVLIDATVDNFYRYEVRLSCRFREQEGEDTTVPYMEAVRIVDTAGGVMLERSRDFGPASQSQKRQERIKTYRQLIAGARGIVFCYDITETESFDWIRSFEDLEHSIATFDGIRKGEPRRIAVAFTKTEYLFSLDGRDAVSRALDRGQMIARIQRALQRTDSDILMRLQTLEARNAGRIEVRCFPTSAFGYVFQNGCANYSHRTNNWLIGDDTIFKAEKGADPIGGSEFFGKFWRPMLTIDPFVYAVFGSDPAVQSKFMYTLDEILQPDTAPAAPDFTAAPDTAPTAPESKAEASFFRILNRAGQKRRDGKG